jgi:hypothetical protein
VRATTEKESRKWLDGLHVTVTLVPQEIRLVTIADREADIFEFLDQADHLAAEYVIRAAQDRSVAGEMGRLWTHMAAPDSRERDRDRGSATRTSRANG